ncbi:hypothetical protein NE237_007682 [Protea cynaroides]|uniref:Uncharacterized protein n=1 Tax=Protea cynaroides TaxID=273540 RepID=A0A9Q0KPK4_9MAGN|nr:hypothetical protein NE237_007682 [Protea cynaroides]
MGRAGGSSFLRYAGNSPGRPCPNGASESAGSAVEKWILRFVSAGTPSIGSPMERSPELIAQLDLPAWRRPIDRGGPTLVRPFLEGPIGKPTLPAAAPFLRKKGRLRCIKPGTLPEAAASPSGTTRTSLSPATGSTSQLLNDKSFGIGERKEVSKDELGSVEFQSARTTCRVQLMCRVYHLDNESATLVPDALALAATPTFAFSNAGYADAVCAWLCTGLSFALAS